MRYFEKKLYFCTLAIYSIKDIWAKKCLESFLSLSKNV